MATVFLAQARHSARRGGKEKKKEETQKEKGGEEKRERSASNRAGVFREKKKKKKRGVKGEKGEKGGKGKPVGDHEGAQRKRKGPGSPLSVQEKTPGKEGSHEQEARL